MEKLFFTSGTLFALTGVITRSLSSHAIHDFLIHRGKLENFNLAADYLILHGLALLIVALLCHLFPQGDFAKAGWAFIFGSLLFQVSVLVKSCMNLGAFGLVTPLGGAVLMAGWLLLLWAGLKTFQ